MGIKSRKYKTKSLTHHSDRGFQYCSNDYQRLLKKRKISCSMTESYDPYANAVAERINGIIKQEFIGEKLNLNLSLMKELIKESINIYNNKRPHLSCQMLTPSQMHLQDQVKIKTYKNKNICKNVFADV